MFPDNARHFNLSNRHSTEPMETELWLNELTKIKQYEFLFCMSFLFKQLFFFKLMSILFKY